jgi:hypothetical protein
MNDIQDEEISVSTIHTTKSDRSYARKQIMKNLPRYSSARGRALTNGYYFDAKDINQVYSSVKSNKNQNKGVSRQSIKQVSKI